MTKRETDNHNLNKYDAGDDWDYNADMDHIEQRLVVRDTEANRSNYTPHDGALFIATDTGAEYDGDGSSWTKADREVQSLSAEKGAINHGLVRGRNKERIDASKFDGADADARLDAALTEATQYSVIYLEEAAYSANRTISTQLTFIGVSQGRAGAGTEITGTWTLDSRCVLKQVSGGGSITVNSDYSSMAQCSMNASAAISVAGDGFRYVNNVFGDVTFQSGASGGLVDGCVGTSFTDNDGGNTQGDIA